METWIKKETVYQGNIFEVVGGTIRTEDGREYPRQVVINPGGVGVVAILNGHITLVKQFRISIGRQILEIPSGRREENESPEACARRELLEEVGYAADKMELLAEYYTAVGFSTEKMYIYLATELTVRQASPEVDENIELIQLSLADARDRLDRGEFEDSKTIIGLREAFRRLNM
jgi:ADP-ribose pyrophosphatase